MKEMDVRSLTAWLLEAGGPVVRWRTAAELAPGYDRDGGISQQEQDRLAEDALSAPVVLAWIERLDLGDLAERLFRLVNVPVAE